MCADFQDISCTLYYFNLKARYLAGQWVILMKCYICVPVPIYARIVFVMRKDSQLIFFFRYKVMKNWGVIGGIAAALAAGIYVIWGPITERKKRRKGKNEAFASWPVDLTQTFNCSKTLPKGEDMYGSLVSSILSTVFAFKQKLILVTHYFISSSKKIYISPPRRV